jgi:nucleoside-diphosphate-sugar epimerase
MELKDKTILVTGGAGFIGSNLCEVLLKHDIKKLFIFDNFSAGKVDNLDFLDNRVVIISADIRNYNDVESVVLESDIVFNLAACNIGNSIKDIRYDMETNIGGTLNILQAARKKPEIRIIHASSGSVLGSSDKPMVEDSILKPTTPYAISKMGGEKYCKFFADEYGVKVSIIRYFHVFGPKQDPTGSCGVVNIFLNRILNGEPPIVWGSGKQVKCFTFVLDSITATLLLLEKEETIGQIYNVASSARINIIDLANLLINKYSKIIMSPVHTDPKIGENLSPIPDTTKIHKLGWNTNYTFEQGLDISFNWLIKRHERKK